jgi:hypothetical protein
MEEILVLTLYYLVSAAFHELNNVLDLKDMKSFLLKNYSRCVLLNTGTGRKNVCDQVVNILELPYEKVEIGMGILKNPIQNVLIERQYI